MEKNNNKFDPLNPYPISEELMMYFTSKKEDWFRYETPAMIWGILFAVFQLTFKMAPTEQDAIAIILDCLEDARGGSKSDKS